MSNALVGCCGWPEARPRYFDHFPVVELQDTFYEPPSAALAEKWRRQAPAHFRFAMKAWQLITHAATSPTYRRLKTPIDAKARGACGSFRPGAEVRAAWERTLAVARAVHAAAIVFQCPASFRPSAENVANLKTFFRQAEREGWLMVWEPRGEWPPAQVRAISEECDLVHCVDPFQGEPTYGKALYFRLHGRGTYRYRYSDEELRELRETLARQQAASPRPAFVMFNNISMRDDALRFLELVSSPREPAPPS